VRHDSHKEDDQIEVEDEVGAAGEAVVEAVEIQDEMLRPYKCGLPVLLLLRAMEGQQHQPTQPEIRTTNRAAEGEGDEEMLPDLLRIGL
jgi:hypothetical protein